MTCTVHLRRIAKMRLSQPRRSFVQDLNHNQAHRSATMLQAYLSSFLCLLAQLHHLGGLSRLSHGCKGRSFRQGCLDERIRFQNLRLHHEQTLDICSLRTTTQCLSKTQNCDPPLCVATDVSEPLKHLLHTCLQDAACGGAGDPRMQRLGMSVRQPWEHFAKHEKCQCKHARVHCLPSCRPKVSSRKGRSEPGRS